MTPLSQFRNGFPALCLSAMLLATTACTSVGPSTGKIANAGQSVTVRGIQVISIDEPMIRQRPATATPDFATTLGYSPAVGETVGAGDVLEVTVWEAPPAVLFNPASPGQASVQTSRASALPEFLVGPSGRISMPFAGQVQAAGRTLPEIERDITERLRGKAHLPQVAVRRLRNMSSTVAIVGEVTTATRMPLTPKGETLLDALAAAGGSKLPSDKLTIQVSRDGQVHAMPLSTVIGDPRQNVVLRPGDVVTALYQPYSFTVLGASGKNEEINFEATGVTLAQAMGRVGGLQEGRADPKGVFLFRWEDPALFPNRGPEVGVGPDGRIPVIYRVDLKDPATYFAMQHFAVRDKDVLYVSTNPVAEFQRVVGLVASTVFPIVSLDNALRRN